MRPARLRCDPALPLCASPATLTPGREAAGETRRRAAGRAVPACESSRSKALEMWLPFRTEPERHLLPVLKTSGGDAPALMAGSPWCSPTHVQRLSSFIPQVFMERLTRARYLGTGVVQIVLGPQDLTSKTITAQILRGLCNCKRTAIISFHAPNNPMRWVFSFCR